LPSESSRRNRKKPLVPVLIEPVEEPAVIVVEADRTWGSGSDVGLLGGGRDQELRISASLSNSRAAQCGNKHEFVVGVEVAAPAVLVGR
jgi:hypothetical protein